MTASTKNTIWALGIVGVLVFLAIKLWPALSRKLGASGSSGSTDGSSTSSPYYPSYPENESASQGNLLSQLLNALSGNPSSAKASGQIGTGGAMPSSIGPGPYGSPSTGIVTAGGATDLWTAIANAWNDEDPVSSTLDAAPPANQNNEQGYNLTGTVSQDSGLLSPDQTALFDVTQMAVPMSPSGYDPTDSGTAGAGIDDEPSS